MMFKVFLAFYLKQNKDVCVVEMLVVHLILQQINNSFRTIQAKLFLLQSSPATNCFQSGEAVLSFSFLGKCTGNDIL